MKWYYPENNMRFLGSIYGSEENFIIVCHLIVSGYQLEKERKLVRKSIEAYKLYVRRRLTLNAVL